ncbi:MAG: hypothetical protein ABI140_09910 [Jatrophihabitantaceae bacterium]
MTAPDQPTDWLPPEPLPVDAPAVAGGWQQPGPYAKAAPGTSSRRGPVLVVAAALVGLLVAGGGFGLSRQLANNTVSLTYNGEQVDHPERTLSAAEAKVDQVIAHQPSVQASNHHCYFARPANGTKAERAEVADGIYCGPMLLISSQQGDRFLHFTVSSDRIGSRVRLTPSEPSGETMALPAHEQLTRPGSPHQPPGGAELQVPKAPAATADAFVSVDAVGPQQDLASQRNTGMYGYDGGVRLTSTASTPYYGSGAQARSAAAGQRLIAFSLQYGGPKESSLGELDLGVAVNGSGLQKLPEPDKATEFKVISVPISASSVDLVLRSKGFIQRISLLTGKAGSDNITVMSRVNWQDDLSVSKDVPVTLRTSDGSVSGTMHLKVTEADLEFFEDDTGKSAPASPHGAFLHLQMSYTVSGIADVKGHELMPQVLSLRTSDGHTLHARDVASANADYIYLAFDIPGDFTGGTVTIGGTDSLDGVQLIMPQPFSFPLKFPAG